MLSIPFWRKRHIYFVTNLTKCGKIIIKMTSTESRDKPKGFTQSLWYPLVFFSPFILFQLYVYFSNNDFHGPLSRIITIQMVLLTFLIPGYIGWALVNWIEKRDPSFFEEDSSKLDIPLREEFNIMGKFNEGHIFLIIGLALILVDIFLINHSRVEGVLIIMGSMILGISLWGLISIKTLRKLDKVW